MKEFTTLNSWLCVSSAAAVNSPSPPIRIPGKSLHKLHNPVLETSLLVFFVELFQINKPDLSSSATFEFEKNSSPTLQGGSRFSKHNFEQLSGNNFDTC